MGNHRTMFRRQDEQLHAACFAGKLGEVKKLLEDEVGVNTRNPMGLAPLHMAAMAGNTNVVAYLLTRAAEIEAKDDQGRTPLHVSCQEGDNESFALLLAKKASINARTNNGASPLHLAAFHDEKDIVKWLLEAGADVHAVDAQGQTVLDDKDPDPEIHRMLTVHVSQQRVVVEQLTQQPMASSGCGGTSVVTGTEKVLIPRTYKPAEAQQAAKVSDSENNFRGAGGGISANHPLLQPLAAVDLLGNPMPGPTSELQIEENSNKCKEEPRGIAFNNDSLDRMFAQLQENC